MTDEEEEEEEAVQTTKTVWDWEIINANKPIWTRAAKDVEKEECVHSVMAPFRLNFMCPTAPSPCLPPPQQPNTATSHSLHPLPIQRQIYGPHCLYSY